MAVACNTVCWKINLKNIQNMFHDLRMAFNRNMLNQACFYRSDNY